MTSFGGGRVLSFIRSHESNQQRQRLHRQRQFGNTSNGYRNPEQLSQQQQQEEVAMDSQQHHHMSLSSPSAIIARYTAERRKSHSLAPRRRTSPSHTSDNNSSGNKDVDTSSDFAAAAATSRAKHRQHIQQAAALRKKQQEDEEAECVALISRETHEFERLAAAVGLPWLDKKILTEGLHNCASFHDLPRVQHLNEILRTQTRISASIRDLYRERRYLLDEVVNETCAMQKHCCSRGLHERACSLMREIDRLTGDIVILVCEEWRRHLNQPLPFFIDGGNNVILEMLEECSAGAGIVSLVSNHLWSTCRHLPFFYASTFDANPQRLNMRRSEIALMEAEYDKQLQLVVEQLELSKMGVYNPVLNFRVKMRSLCNNSGQMDATLYPISDARWKKVLVDSYSQALAALMKQSTLHGSVRGLGSSSKDVHSAAAQFTMFSSKSLHLRYYRRWVAWAGLRHQRKENLDRLLLISQHRHTSWRFTAWCVAFRDRTHRLRSFRALHTKTSHKLMRLYLGRWFRSYSMFATARKIRRAIYLNYYNKFLLRYVARKLKQAALGIERPPRHALAVSLCRRDLTAAHLGAVCALSGTRRAMFRVEKEEGGKRRGIAAEEEEEWGKVLSGEATPTTNDEATQQKKEEEEEAQKNVAEEHTAQEEQQQQTVQENEQVPQEEEESNDAIAEAIDQDQQQKEDQEQAPEELHHHEVEEQPQEEKEKLEQAPEEAQEEIEGTAQEEQQAQEVKAEGVVE